MTVPGRPDIYNLQQASIHTGNPALILITYQDGQQKYLHNWDFLETFDTHPHWIRTCKKKETILINLILRIKLIIIAPEISVDTFSDFLPHQINISDRYSQVLVDVTTLLDCGTCNSANDKIVTGNCCRLKNLMIDEFIIEQGIDI